MTQLPTQHLFDLDPPKLPSSAARKRCQRAEESFRSAEECIGPVTKGLSLFVITRGQFSMLDALLHCIQQIGKARITLWTWTAGEYDILYLEKLRKMSLLSSGDLYLDHSMAQNNTRTTNVGLVREWRNAFGPNTVHFLRNHAKMATLENDQFKILIRGSMNLNQNVRFEQMDITEGGPDFDLVKQIEAESPGVPETSTTKEFHTASKIGELDMIAMPIFNNINTWKPTR